MLKADFHIHTKYSMDCNSSLEDIINRCLETGISCITIADHDAIEGALNMAGLAPFKVIVAEEVLTPQGEVIGMFIKEKVPSGLPIEQAIARIKDQGGLVCLPHPFDAIRGLRIDGRQLEELVPQVDMIEVFNARSHFINSANKAHTFARKFELPGTAGSDAHTIGEIGETYVEMPEFNNSKDFLKALRQGRIHRHGSSLLVHLSSFWAKIGKSLYR